MGAFYGSILIRADNSDVVRNALEVAAKNVKSRFLVGPALNGWVSVFPNNAGQSDRVSAEIAKGLPNDILHLVVHDDDIFSYYFYRNGRLADRYNSCPDYFGRVSSEEKQQCQGHPEVFDDLLPNPASLKNLRSLLTKRKFTFEQERMTEFVKLLDLPNALSSYEYLQSGERDGIKGWERFFHIPDLGPEIAAKQAAEARIESQKDRLKETSLLLAEISPPKVEKALITSIVWGTDSSNNGLVLAWRHFNLRRFVDGSKSTTEFYSLEPPWKLPPKPLGLKTNATAMALSTSPSGKWLAGGFAWGDESVRVWDWRQKKLSFGVKHTQANVSVGFSEDEQFVVCKGSNELTFISLAEKRPVKTVKGVEGARAGAIHPSGDFAAVALQTVLAIIDLKTQKITKQLRVNRGQKKMNRWPNQPDDAVAQKLGQNPEKLKKLGIKSQQELKSWIKENRYLKFVAQEHVFDLRFSPDGSQLFIASNGIRVFDWKRLLEANDDTPSPEFSVDAPGDDENDPNLQPLAYCVRFDPRRNLILSSCLAGVIQYLNLATGRSGTVLKVPGEMGIWRLELTADRKALCCHCSVRPKQRLRDNKSSDCVQIWNYPALCKAAGLD